MRYYASPRVVMDRALRNTINNNTQVDISLYLHCSALLPTTYISHSGLYRWLFVCDMNVSRRLESSLDRAKVADLPLCLKGNLYIGIKKTGGFQHSSFLYGARVTAAGLIKVSLLLQHCRRRSLNLLTCISRSTKANSPPSRHSPVTTGRERCISRPSSDRSRSARST